MRSVALQAACEAMRAPRRGCRRRARIAKLPPLCTPTATPPSLSRYLYLFFLFFLIFDDFFSNLIAFQDELMDASVVETYYGEWKNDKRTGYGISVRSDGLRYEGEWFNNRKYGYGVTTFRDNTKEEGKYKNNVLITNSKKKHLFLIRSAKFQERLNAAVQQASRACKIAEQKADIAVSRTSTARGKAELADIAAEHAREDSELAQQTARQFAPDFRQPGLERYSHLKSSIFYPAYQ